MSRLAVRRTLVLAVAACALAPLSAQAAPPRTPRPQVIDIRNDAPLPSLDVVQAVVRRGAGDSLEAWVTLDATPDVPAKFSFTFDVADCSGWTIELAWNVTSSSTQLLRRGCDYPLPEAVAGAATTGRVEGNHVVLSWQNIAKYGIRNGAKLVALTARTYQVDVAVVATVGGRREVTVGDIGWARDDYVVGSERARKR